MSEAGAQEAARKIGELVLPVGREAAWHVAKVLKAAKRNLYCAPGSGRRYGEVLEHHLTNLILAIGCGAPKDAVHTVDTFNALRPRETWVETRVVVEGNPLIGDRLEQVSSAPLDPRPLIQSETLGAALVEIVRTFAGDTLAHEEREGLRRGLMLELTIEPWPQAKLSFVDYGEGRQVLSTNYLPDPDLLGERAPPEGGPRATLQRGFTGADFDTLAQILKASRGDRSGTLPLPISNPMPGSVGEETTIPESPKAAGTGIHDGLLTGQPATKAPQAAHINTEQPTHSPSERATPEKQADRSLTAGDRRHAERRPGGAYCAAA